MKEGPVFAGPSSGEARANGGGPAWAGVGLCGAGPYEWAGLSGWGLVGQGHVGADSAGARLWGRGLVGRA